jgi:MFS family permease
MANHKIKERLRRLSPINVPRNVLVSIVIIIFTYMVCFLSLPFFGPVLSFSLDGFRALAIEKGRFMQTLLAVMALSCLVSGFLSDRVRTRLKIVWTSSIVISAATYSFSLMSTLSIAPIMAIAMGVALGISPAALGAYFTDHVSPEDRGRVMGVILGLSMPVAYTFFLADSTGFNLPTTVKVTIIAVIILSGVLTTLLYPKENIPEPSPKGRRGATTKQLLYYAISMSLFYWVTGIFYSVVMPTLIDHIDGTLFYVVWTIPYLVGSILGGVLLDSMGRKFPTILGLAITGVSLAVIVLFGINLGYIYLVPLAIGFAMVTVMSFIVWGDLAPANYRGTYYGAGIGLMVLFSMIGLMSAGTVFGGISTTQLRSFILFSSIALFLCIPPLIKAEEVLPLEMIERRKMKEYIEQAKKKYIEPD